MLWANLIAWPTAWFAIHRWLQNFAYRIEIGWWMFALAGGLDMLIALLTVSTQAIKAALANPVEAPFAKTYDFIADANNLPAWTEAFKSVANGSAQLETPNGSVEIGLRVHDSRAAGAIDWEMTFPDGSVAWAYSRVIPASNDRSIYSFILMPPPLPLEQLEGGMEQQSRTLRKELSRLAEILHA